MPWVREYKRSESARVVVARALRRIEETGYHLLTRNCEHFATWCKSGRHESAQVRTVCSAVKKSVLKTTVNRSIKKLAGTAITRTTNSCVLVADGLQLVTRVVATNIFGISLERAQTLGRAAGIVSSVGLGAAMGGPIGALMGFGLWLFGELLLG